jgi:hypothetical protein
MRVLVFTCDPYYELIEGFSKLFNRHWDPNQKVDVLGFTKPEFPLPENFTFHSAGRQSDFPSKSIYEPFVPIINQFKEDYFTIFLEDTFLIRDVDHDLFKKAEDKINAGTADSVAMFWGGPEQFSRTLKHDEYFLEYPQEMNYRVNVAPQIITKEYFFRYMKPGISLHQYEADNIIPGRNNGATLLCGRKPIAPWVNVLRHGRFHHELIENLEKNAGKSFNWNDWQVIEKEDEEIIYGYRNWTSKR